MSDGYEMTHEDMENAAARWGADTALWPDAERRAAAALTAGSPDAAALLEALQAMEADLAFANAEGAKPSDALTARILGDAAEATPRVTTTMPAKDGRDGAKSGLLNWFGPFWQPAAACAASAVLGIWIGYLAPENVAEAATAMASFDTTAEVASMELDDDPAFELSLAFADTGAFE